MASPGHIEQALVRAREAAHDIAESVGAGGDLASAKAAFATLLTVAIEHPGEPMVIRIAVCGAVRLAAAGRAGRDIALVRQAHSHLGDLARLLADDPLPRRAYAEATVDLMLAEARADGFETSLALYRTVARLSDRFLDDDDLLEARAKAAANLVALALEAERPDEAGEALDELSRLETDRPGVPMVRQHLARGIFNRLAREVHGDAPPTSKDSLDTLVAIMRRSPGQPELIGLAAEGAFALVTGLGTRGHIEEARHAYDILSDLTRMPASGPDVVGRLAEAAFNLITDLCEREELAEAQLIYDELAGLSVLHGGDPAIRLAHAKAATNLALSHDGAGDLTAAAVISEDLKALLSAFPDDPDLFAVAAFYDAAE